MWPGLDGGPPVFFAFAFGQRILALFGETTTFAGAAAGGAPEPLDEASPDAGGTGQMNQ